MALTTLIPNLLPPFTKPQTVSYINNGISTDVNGVKFPLQTGVPVQPIYTFKVIPAPQGAVVAQPYTTTTSASGFTMTAITTTQSVNVSGVPFTQVTPITFLGNPGALLDCERGVVIDFQSVTTATTIATIQGYDYRGVACETTTPTIPIGTLNYAFASPITVFKSLSFSSNPLPAGGLAVNLTTGSYIGFPYLLPSESYVIAASWDGTSLLPSGGTFIGGYPWRQLDGAYNVNSLARGIWSLPSAADGIKEFIMTAYYYGADSELNAEINNLNQSSLKIVGVQKTTSSSYPNPKYVWPYLVSQDLTGIQINNGNPNPPTATTATGFAGDSAFIYEYYTLINS